MPVEVEARFRADRPERLTALAAADSLAEATLGAARTFDETDRYLDTADGRLAAARWACRLRSRGDAYRVSLKGPPEASGSEWLHRRPEIEGPATASLDPGDWPSSDARSFLESLAGGGKLRERMRLDPRRTERAVAVGGDRLGTLTLDRVGVISAGAGVGELLIVELELATDDPSAAAVLERLAAALEDTPGLSPEPRTKLERALELAGAGGDAG